MVVINCPHCSKPAPTEADRCPHCGGTLIAVTANPTARVSLWLGIANVALFIVICIRFYRLVKGDTDLIPLAFALAGGPWITAMILLAVGGLITGFLGIQKPNQRGKAVSGIVLGVAFLLLAVL